MTLNASAAVVGVVYLTPKGKQLRREPDRDDFPGKVIFRRLLDNELMPLEGKCHSAFCHFPVLTCSCCPPAAV